MKSIVLPSRYAFFASFVICNAIIASVAIWNLGIAQVIGRHLGVDAYMAFVSILGLLVYFAVALTELLRTDPFSAHVWFECAWVGIFFFMELAAAIAASAILPSAMCNADVSKMSSACASTRAALVFSWVLTLLSLIYILLLGLSAFLRSKDDHSVWFISVHRYPWQEYNEKGGSDVAAALPRFRSDPIPVSLPKSRRSYAPPKSLSNSSISTASEETAVEPIVHSTPLPPPPRPTKKPIGLSPNPSWKSAPQSLYPRHVDENSDVPLQPPMPPHVGPSPQPLGNWPRANEPVRKKTTPALPALKTVDMPVQRLEPSARSATSSRSARSAPTRSATSVKSASPNPISQAATPTHPKKPSGDWRSRVVVPPPLDLSKISTSRSRPTR